MSISRRLLLFAVFLICFNLSFAKDEKKTVPIPHHSQRQHSHTKHMVQIVSNQHKKREKKDRKDNNQKEQSQFARKGQAQKVLKADLNSNFIETRERIIPFLLRKNKTQSNIDRA